MHNYYTIINRKQIAPQSYQFSIQLNSDCRVYDGHFPGNPIAPGACNIQMIKECVEYIIGHQLQYLTISRCKFLQPINLSDTTKANNYTLQLSVNDNNVDATLKQDDIIFIKLKSTITI